MQKRCQIVGVLLASLLLAGSSVLSISAEGKGPVLYFDVSEGERETLVDKSGNGNNGVVCGAKLEKENGKYALDFDGIDDYVEVRDSTALRFDKEFTLEVMVKPCKVLKEKGSGMLRLLAGKDGEYWSPESAFGLYVKEGQSGGFSGYARYGSRNATNQNDIYAVSCPVREPETWHKVCLVKTDTKLKMFVDSMFMAETKVPEKIIASGRPLRIGGNQGRFFKGFIREVRLFDYAREIKCDSWRSPRKFESSKLMRLVRQVKNICWRFEKKMILPRIVMVTSLDGFISSTPLLDVTAKQIKPLNDSPFDGITFALMDHYSAQPPVDKDVIMKKVAELKKISSRPVWVRVNMNRIYQRAKLPSAGYCTTYYDEKQPKTKLSCRGLSVDEVQRQSTPCFASIKAVDIYDEAGALSDFYRLWELGLIFAGRMRSGIILDMEDYHGLDAYSVAKVAKAQGKSSEEVIQRCREIGANLADIAAKTYPETPVIALFTLMAEIDRDGGKTIAHICEGMLMRAKEKRIPLKLIEGGEWEVGYVNKTIEGLEAKIARRWYWYRPWLERFPDNFFLGGTITLWDDPSKLSAWTKADAGENNPFKSLEDFKPFLKALFSNYDYIWIYQPTCIDYKPYDPEIAPAFHRKLEKVIDETAREMVNDL